MNDRHPDDEPMNRMLGKPRQPSVVRGWSPRPGQNEPEKPKPRSKIYTPDAHGRGYVDTTEQQDRAKIQELRRRRRERGELSKQEAAELDMLLEKWPDTMPVRPVADSRDDSAASIRDRLASRGRQAVKRSEHKRTQGAIDDYLTKKGEISPEEAVKEDGEPSSIRPGDNERGPADGEDSADSDGKADRGESSS